MTRLIRLFTAAGYALLITLAVVVGYRLIESRIAVGVYRDRLVSISEDYEHLRGQYNLAVRRTAVTELRVSADGRHLSVNIRTIDGQSRAIDTPFDPSREIFCDYVLTDGRLWIRRVYDDRTSPRDGLLIDPTLTDIDWNNNPAARYGKVVYRALGPGRWIVTVTGDGSLGLSQQTGDEPATLRPPPAVRDFNELEKQIDRRLDKITTSDVLHHLMTGGTSGDAPGD
ncbi:MAG: hypothetical protein WC058_02560 [Phycisphaeraceae bacterium]